MLNGVGDQFVHDESERHPYVSVDDQRFGIDDEAEARRDLAFELVLARALRGRRNGEKRNYRHGQVP
jgi:hypothetical protein